MVNLTVKEMRCQLDHNVVKRNYHCDQYLSQKDDHERDSKRYDGLA